MGAELGATEGTPILIQLHTHAVVLGPLRQDHRSL